MNLKKVSKIATVTSVLASIVLISFVVSKYWFNPASTPEVKTGPVALKTNSSAEEGSSFPLFDKPRPLSKIQFVDGKGRPLSLADFRGRLVLLNIWATWCVPCRREMPTLDRLQAILGGQDFEVLALSIDQAGSVVVKAFYEKLELETLQIYVDASTKATRDLGIVGIPTTLLVGRNGNELGRLVGPAEWDSPEMISFFRKQISWTKKPRTTSLVRPLNKKTEENDK